MASLEEQLKAWKGRLRNFEGEKVDLRFDREIDDEERLKRAAEVDEGIALCENRIKELQVELDEGSAGVGESCMTRDLFEMTPSDQVASNAEKRHENAQKFARNVVHVETVVGDLDILTALLMTEQGETKEETRYNVDAISRRLNSVSDGKFHLSEEQEVRPSKLAKLSANGLSLGTNMECEDVRSGNFATQWNVMLFDVVGVLAMPQVVTRTANWSTSKLDILLAKANRGNAAHENFIEDFNVIFEWNVAFKEGSDREGAHYGLHINDATARKKFLIITVSPGHVLVHGLYWKENVFEAQRVQLASYNSLQDCLKEWLLAIVWFVRNAGDGYAPQVPLLIPEATNSQYLKGQNVYKVHTPSDPIVIKVYDYKCRPYVSKENRRWMNFDLIQKFYPPGVKKLVDTDDLQMFSCPFIEGGKALHIPRSKEQFLVIGRGLEDLHATSNIFGDVRLGNMLFPTDGDGAYLIDFDFCRAVSEPPPLYIEGYARNNLPRHVDAKELTPMKQLHDVCAYWKCWRVLCGKQAEEQCPFGTMTELVTFISAPSSDELTVTDPHQISELSCITGSPFRRKGRGMALRPRD